MQFACRRKPTLLVRIPSVRRSRSCRLQSLPAFLEAKKLRAKSCQVAAEAAEKSFLWRSASLRACLRQQGIVIFQQLTARVNSCPDTRLHTRGLFRRL